MRLTILTFALCSVVACSSSEVEPAASGGAGDPAEKASEAASNVADDSNRSCGAATCGAGEYCIKPCVGGALMPCTPEDDAGACPSGTGKGHRYCAGPGGAPTLTGCTTLPEPAFCSKAPACSGVTTMPKGRQVECVCP